jgi:predicted lipoprotein with Yx(FWY)xxD motif
MTLSKSITLLAGAAALVVTALAIAGCGGSSSDNATPTTSSGTAATIGIANEGDLGKILVDAQGRTLYLFQKDTGTTSECTGACAVNWPPLVSGKPTEGGGVDASLVGTTNRSDGKRQVTYNGHPLYHFQGDKQAGDTNGEGLNAFGGSWYALSSAGDQVAPPANSGGGGYGY